jgi:hypothetical protein
MCWSVEAQQARRAETNAQAPEEVCLRSRAVGGWSPTTCLEPDQAGSSSRPIASGASRVMWSTANGWSLTASASGPGESDALSRQTLAEKADDQIIDLAA